MIYVINNLDIVCFLNYAHMLTEELIIKNVCSRNSN